MGEASPTSASFFSLTNFKNRNILQQMTRFNLNEEIDRLRRKYPIRVHYSAKSLSVALFMLLLLSCHGKAGIQNKTVPQEADISLEQSTGTVLAENNGNKALLQASAETVHTDMTLIPSVEPELLRNVMPHTWRKLSRLTETEEQAFIWQNVTALARIAETMRNEDLGWNWTNIGRFEYYAIYRQHIGTDTFYRILVTADSSPDFLSQAICFVQYLVYEGSLLIMPSDRISGSYNAVTNTQGGSLRFFHSIDIIPSKERVKGILQTIVEIGSIDDPNDWSGTAQRRKGQIYGITESKYYFLDDLLNGGNRLSPIEINASECLVDPVSPLRYSLQNAFDGDPSTSYVENTENDLMNVQIYVNINIIRKFAVINGYAQNMEIYKNNNRIKTNGIDNPITLNDNTLGYQIFDNNHQALGVTGIYKGDKYNDTCLAEFNIYTTEHGWLFGDIDE
jgi:hypothetical protein